MYADGTLDLMMMVAVAAFKPPEEKEESLASVVKKAKTQHFPVFEKVGCGDPVWPRQGGPGGGQRQLGAQILQGSRAGLTSTRVTLPSPRPPGPSPEPRRQDLGEGPTQPASTLVSLPGCSDGGQ